jgi:CRP/FNR family transcriptional regulator, cyclic AMP receptor protein
MSSLPSIPAFRALSPAALDAVARDSKAVRLGADAVIRHAGDPPSTVVLLLSGTVVASYAGPSGIEVWPARWEGPAIVDKPSVLDGGKSLTGLVAKTECIARLLPRARFLRLLDEEESVRKHVLNRLAQDVLASQQRLTQAVTLSAVAQVAAWLNAHDRAHAVAWRGSQEDLARALGLSRVTVNRALARLADAGALRLTPHGIVISDHQRLGLFSDGP